MSGRSLVKLCNKIINLPKGYNYYRTFNLEYSVRSPEFTAWKKDFEERARLAPRYYLKIQDYQGKVNRLTYNYDPYGENIFLSLSHSKVKSYK